MSGAPTPNVSNASRILTLEGEVRRLAGELERIRQAESLRAVARHVRICRTTTSGTYPVRGANTVEIMFSDDLSSYTKTAGTQTPSWTDHLNSPQAVAHWFDRVYYAEDARVFALLANRHYWIIGGRREADRVKGELVGAMATTDATHTIDNLEGIDGTTPIASTLTFYNDHDWAGPDNGVCRVEYNWNASRWEAYQVDCP